MKIPDALAILVDPVAMQRHLATIEAGLRAMTWKRNPGPADAPADHDVLTFTGESGEGSAKRIATVVGYTIPGQSRRVDGAIVAMDGDPAITRLTPALAQLAFDLASAAALLSIILL